MSSDALKSACCGRRLDTKHVEMSCYVKWPLRINDWYPIRGGKVVRTLIRATS